MSDKNYWIEIAKYDLETAEAMLKSKRYLYVGFMCHQSIEKILKAIYAYKSKEFPPRIHNLARLLKLTGLDDGISDDYLNIIHELNPLNIATRYPDQELEILKDLDYEYTSELLDKTRRLFNWLLTKL